MDEMQRNMGKCCLPFLGSHRHHRSSWTQSAAVAKQKPIVDGVATDPIECRVQLAVSVKEA